MGGPGLRVGGQTGSADACDGCVGGRDPGGSDRWRVSPGGGGFGSRGSEVESGGGWGWFWGKGGLWGSRAAMTAD